MAFYKAVKMKTDGKWYPQAVQVDQPFTTDEVADRLAQISTVSRAARPSPGLPPAPSRPSTSASPDLRKKMPY